MYNTRTKLEQGWDEDSIYFTLTTLSLSLSTGLSLSILSLHVCLALSRFFFSTVFLYRMPPLFPLSLLPPRLSPSLFLSLSLSVSTHTLRRIPGSTTFLSTVLVNLASVGITTASTPGEGCGWARWATCGGRAFMTAEAGLRPTPGVGWIRLRWKFMLWRVISLFTSMRARR